MPINEGKEIDKLYGELDRLKKNATEIQQGIISDYQEYILGNYAQIRKQEVVLQEYLDQSGLNRGAGR